MKNESYDYCHVSELTDKGCKRAANEDWMAHFISPNGLVAVVCDGMGGHVGGQIASHTAVDAIKQYMMVERVGTSGEQIVEAINVANRAILDRTEAEPKLKGMGATCVMLIVREGKVCIGSVGDSRVYLIRNHTIRQLTVDESYVQTLVDKGEISHEEAEHHPRKNEITNALGLKEMKPATVLPEPIIPEAGDCFLLCSDGLSGMVADQDICKVVSKQRELSQQERVETLVEMAKQNGGLDNITCQIVEFAVAPGNLQPSPSLKWIKSVWAILGLAALVALGVWAWPKIFPNQSSQLPSIEINTSQTTNEQTPDTVEYRLKEIVIEGINGPNSWTHNSSPFHDETFLVLTEDRDFEHVRVKELYYDDTVLDTIVIDNLLPIKDMEITPSEYVKVNYRRNNDQEEKDSVDCALAFNDKFENEYDGEDFDVTVTLHQKDKRPHTYIIIIPVRKKPSLNLGNAK